MVKLGSIVSGVVESVTAQAVYVCVTGKTYLKGIISPEHLADHHGNFIFCFFIFLHCSIFSYSVALCCAGICLVQSGFADHGAVLKSVLKPGYEFDQLLVLGILKLLPGKGTFQMPTIVFAAEIFPIQ